MVGARFVCTTCKTRGVTPACSCGAKGALLDITAPAQSALLKELTSPPPSPGAPTREELFWDGLRSPTQWVLSALLAIVVGIVTASGENAWTWPKLAYLVAEVMLLTLLFRVPMLAIELLFRLFVTVLSLLAALGAFVAGKLVRRRRLVVAARDWVARAEQVLNGEYFWRRSMVELREPPVLSELLLKGALLPSAELCVLVARGKHGALTLGDAAAPAFHVVLASGETVIVSIETGALSAPNVAAAASQATVDSPFFPETEALRIAGASSVVLEGGEWSESDQGAGYRAPLEPRTLRGTPERPLLVSFG